MKTKNELLKIFTILFLLAATMTSCDKDVALTGIDLDKVTAEVMVGATQNLIVVFTPVDATNKNIIWESTNTAVATVANGVVTGVSLGNATIKATSDENSLLPGDLRSDSYSFKRSADNCKR